MDCRRFTNLIRKYSPGKSEREFLPSDLVPNREDPPMLCWGQTPRVEGAQVRVYIAQVDELFEFDLDETCSAGRL
jgi:hypothetical protein